MSAYAFLTLKSSIFKNFFILWGCLVDKRFYILGFTPRGGWVLGADHPRGSCAAPSPSPRSSPCSVCRSVALSVWVWLLLLSDHAGENGRRFTPSRGAARAALCSFCANCHKNVTVTIILLCRFGCGCCCHSGNGCALRAPACSNAALRRWGRLCRCAGTWSRSGEDHAGGAAAAQFVMYAVRT